MSPLHDDLCTFITISCRILLRIRNFSVISGTEIETFYVHLGDWLTVHRSITLFDLQLEAQNSYLFTYNTFIKSSTCFEPYPAHLQEVYVVIVYMQPLVSSLSAESDDTRGCIYTITT